MRDEQGEGDRETGSVEVSGGVEHFCSDGVEAQETQMYTSIEKEEEIERWSEM